MSGLVAHLQGDLLQPVRPSPSEIVTDAVERFKPKRRYVLLSGGDGSLAATHWAMNNVEGCEVAHIITGIGIPAVEVFVRETCDREGWRLTTIRAKEDCGQDYDEIVSEHGFPGPAAHGLMYRRLKERPIEKLVRDSKVAWGDKIMLITGICQDDSLVRAGYGGQEVKTKGAQLWVNAIYWMGAAWVYQYLREVGIPRNPVAGWLGFSGECLCGANAAPGELELVRRACPRTADRLEAIQRRVSNRHPWGWEDRPPRPITTYDDSTPLFDMAMCGNCLKAGKTPA